MKVELFNDNFQNFKRYGIPKAQLVIADIPYILGNNAYASNPMWYVGGIIRTERAKKLVRLFSTPTTISTLQNIFTFAIGC